MSAHLDKTSITSVIVTTGDVIKFKTGTVRVLHSTTDDGDVEDLIGVTQVFGLEPAVATVNLNNIVVAFSEGEEKVDDYLTRVREDEADRESETIITLDGSDPEALAEIRQALADFLGMEVDQVEPLKVGGVERE